MVLEPEAIIVSRRGRTKRRVVSVRPDGRVIIESMSTGKVEVLRMESVKRYWRIEGRERS